MKTDTTQQNIPNGWQATTLGKVASITNGSTNTQDAIADGQYPFFDRSIEIKRSNKYLFDDTAIILPGEGAEFIPRIYSGKFDLHQRAYAIFPDKNIVSPAYLYNFLYANRKDFVKSSVGSTVKSLRLPFIQSVDVSFPPIKEQQKIAEILGAVDDDINKTQEVIKTTEKLKHGLMQQLFTRGIGHIKFKETKIGQIPEEWDVVSIRNSSIKLIDGDRGTNYPKHEDFSPEGFCLFLSAKNVSKNGFIFDEVSFISQDKDRALRKGKLEREDIILTSRGTVGNVAYYDEKISFDNIRINSGMLIVRHGEQFDPVFLYRYFSSPQMEAKYSSMGSGSAQPQLPVGSLEQVEIPLIPISEQKEIASIISAVNEKILVNKKLKEKLTLLKKGLMQDLLSGSKRVKV
ncbi:restriction endonuclease subunit S [Patescibacteria group bacterium]|nr:restriction endonuclease subunit S [Patescibacteria group bacterium]MBU1075135.1 restriction endonuclease subunit S [Patescibacteria group bacterium]MBU1951763.1 restriction endonuclease subunit S [Patescibacteria group bacterium]